jgi:hypothetical protein
MHEPGLASVQPEMLSFVCPLSTAPFSIQDVKHDVYNVSTLPADQEM